MKNNKISPRSGGVVYHPCSTLATRSAHRVLLAAEANPPISLKASQGEDIGYAKEGFFALAGSVVFFDECSCMGLLFGAKLQQFSPECPIKLLTS
ncbi:hypothetical protein [Faunimonas pinastri]|uniref:hypothetical protein n=1 Tax=Faunimonas pinastri TaxID=1855383 RepID=UPI0015A537C0|nr:hypothetical protein [Faunimonas pinastri]